MAGYSGTPLPRKLGIKPGSTVVLVDAPADFRLDADTSPGLVPGTDVALLFVTTRSELEHRFPEVAATMDPAGGLWVAWPKKSSGVPTDLNEDALREALLPTGWVDNKVCAVTDVWSGLRFVLRRENRPAPSQ